MKFVSCLWLSFSYLPLYPMPLCTFYVNLINVTPELYDESNIVDEHKFSHTNAFVIYGDYLLHDWNMEQEHFQNLLWHLNTVRNIFEKHLNSGKTRVKMVLDDYDDQGSTKNTEQVRRYWDITAMFQLLSNTLVYGKSNVILKTRTGITDYLKWDTLQSTLL